MPAPEKSKKPKKLDKAKLKKSEATKKKGSSNLLIILSVVGVVVLLAVGITIFMLSGEDQSRKPNTGNQAANLKNNSNDSKGEGKDGAPASMDMNELIAKYTDLITKLGDKAKYDDAAKQLREMLESDVVNKMPGGRGIVLMTIKDMAQAGNEGARTFLKKLAGDSSNAALAQQARKIYDENLKQAGEQDVVATAGGDSEVSDEPTNYLPNKVDVVFSMNMSKFLDSEFNRGIFTTGAFRKEDIDKRLGLPANMVDQLVIGGIKDFNQVVGVIRTTSPYNWDEFKKAVHLDEAAASTVKGKTYYLGKIDFMTEFLGKRVPGIEALRDKAAFWRVDVKTIVYADETTMKDLLENPPELDKSNIPAPNSQLPGEGAGATGGGTLLGGSKLQPSGGTAGGNGSAGVPAIGGAAGGSGAAGAPSIGGETPPPQENNTPAAKPATTSKADKFYTIDAKMRRLLRLTQDSKQDALVIFLDKATSKVPTLVDYVYYLDQLPSIRHKEVDTLALILPATSGSPSLRIGVACKSRSVVKEVSTEIEKLLTRVGKEDMHELFGFDFKVQSSGRDDNEGQASQGGGGGAGKFGGGAGIAGSGSFGRGGGAGGLSMGGASMGTDQGGGGPGRMPPGARPGGGGAGAGAVGGGVGIGGGTLMGGGGAIGGGNDPNNSGNTAANEPTAGGSFSIERSDEYIIIVATVKSSLTEFIDKQMKSWMQQIRGTQEMASGKFRLGDLAASLDFYKNDLVRNNNKVTFPQGAFPRTFDAERGPRPYPAKDRISFFRELLPYIGDDRYFSLRADIDPEKSWNDPANIGYARILVPHFLNPALGKNYNYVKARGVEQPLAATHFVGMAGVGPDAAYLPKSDPRAGIFGYDRVTSPEDVKDGLSNTIYMIEADKALLGPWLQGGGATVRGTSVAGNDVGRRGGFSSPAYSGKDGVWVLMADGSARFLTKDISPEVFKALCTMAGGDSVGAIDLIATKANLEVTPRSEAVSATVTGKKNKIAEEEEVPVKK